MHALKAVDLEVERGAIHGLVGENGAGKSTLGKIVAGVHRPDDGELWVDGGRVSYTSPRDALRDGLTIITQEPTLVPHRSVLENVFLGLESSTAGVVERRKLRRRYAELVERAGIELPANAHAASLRVADQQKVEILRAVARDARLVVMDEPTSALTTDESAKLFEVVRRLRERGTTIIYVSHLLEEVLALVDTVTVLRDGKVVRTAPAAEESPERLVSAMLGRSMELVFPEKTVVPEDAPVVLSARGLSRPPAVQDVSLHIRAGEILGLAGLIGSGRSEVARAIFGADRPAAGDILVAGRQVRFRTPRAAVRAGIALLPEDRKTQGLVLGNQSEAPSTAIAADHIISQTPAANDEVPKDTPVDVIVSTGPEITTVSVPDVTCLSYGQAKSQLSAAGLGINLAGTAPLNSLCSNPNKIAAQDPNAGDEVDSGTVVDVFTGETSTSTPEPT